MPYSLLKQHAPTTQIHQLPAGLEQTLASDYHAELAKLEQQRKQLIKNCWPIRKVAIPSIFIVVIACLPFLHETFSILLILLPLCWLNLCAKMLQEGPLPDYNRLNHQFLTRLLPAFGRHYGRFYYHPKQSIALNRYQNKLYFGTSRHLARSIRSAEQDYYFQGTYRGCDWELEQVCLYGSGAEVLFKGHMMWFNLPRSFDGITTLNLASPLTSSARVHLEQSHFTDTFWVDSTNQIAARAWLTPAVMERFTEINRLCAGTMHAYLEGSSLLLLLPGLEFASPLDINTPISSCLAGQPFIQELAQLFALMDTLLAQFPHEPHSAQKDS
ncbi:DUF3137 domain-containing protein [Alkalimonas mucilaginosa]|uniref:DUF3137 domain-containing protein n=1 Tax=Alkalimonas mucilaginosa TaxID=3057676 RepID=A0ABU7JJA6_9GAMM|nr:DUF3137 domain-containing protein [Alkalimonas sp. MEB004]MEE2025781.1 DUF3137 domain-containing protein [Alkalimonas sp. MEB004]